MRILHVMLIHTRKQRNVIKMLMNIWVRDKLSGYVHQVGTDPHDSLELFDGVVHYVNLQCMEGTYGGGYEFVEAPDPDEYVCVTPEQLMLNRELIHKDLAAKLVNGRECEHCGSWLSEGRQECLKCKIDKKRSKKQ